MLKKISLIGMMATGKTTLGKVLSKKLNLGFIDTDSEIEKKCKKKIPEIFKTHGEKYFRKKEEKIILNILSNNKSNILALGGGSFLNKKIQREILKKTISIWLKPSFNIIYKRCKNSYNRPLLKNNNNLKITLKEIIKDRYPVYSKANIKIEKNGKPIELCNTIIKKLNKENLFR